MAAVAEEFTGTYVADAAHSSVGFAVGHMEVLKFRAGFADIEATLVAGESGLALEGEARIDSVSITSPPEFREHVVNGDDFFNAREHPVVAFRSTGVELEADGRARVEGVLTIKGTAKPVTATGSYRVPVADPFGGTRAALELRTTVDRREWGFDWQMSLPDGGDALGYDVELTAHLELTKQE